MKIKGFSIIAVLLVVVVLVAIGVGGYSLLSQRSITPQITKEKVLDTDAIISQGTSDEPVAIDVDLGATSFAEFDSDLVEAEAELDAALSE